MQWTLIASSSPSDGDAMYNSLRLARKARQRGHSVRLFLMNDGVDVARAGYDVTELRDLLDGCIADGIPVKICTTCVTRCGIGQGEMRDDATMATMADLTDWVEDADRVLTF